MRFVIIIMMSILGLTKIAFGEDFLREQSFISSSYVTDKSCKKSEKYYSKKYNENFYQNLLKTTNVEIIVRGLRDPDGHEPVLLEQVEILKLARCKNYIDDVVFNLLQTKLLHDEMKTGPTMTLESYLSKKEIIAKKSLKNSQSIKTNPFPLARFPVNAFGNKKITIKERMYALYNPVQMKKMAQVMALTLNVMDSIKVETKITFREESNIEDLIVEHSPSDVYRLALRIYSMEKKKLEQDYKSDGLHITNLDILAAAYEMGVVSENEITILTSDEAFYKKDKTFARKMGTYLVKLGVVAAQINPVTAPYALVGLILYNSYQEINMSKERIELENFYFN